MSRRNEIIEIATELFSSRGYCAVSIRCMADEAGVKKTTLYYYFDSKEDLLKQVIKNNIALCRERIASKLDVSPKDFIEALCDHHPLLVLSTIMVEIHSVENSLPAEYMGFWSDVFCLFVRHVPGRDGDLGLRYSLINEFHGAVIMGKLGASGILDFCKRLTGLLDE